MATYKEIHGINVQYRDSDATAIEGDVWYNASTGLLKMYSALGSWASGGNLNASRDHSVGGAGTLTAGVVFGGRDPDPTANVEEYDGSSWTEVTDMPTATGNNTGIGTQTAALSCGGGGDTNGTFEYDGTNWADGGDLPSPAAGINGAGLGTQTAAIRAIGGPSASVVAVSYDGSSWTEIADVVTARRKGGGAGTTTAGLIFGGRQGGGPLSNVEEFDGSSWTEVNNMNTIRDSVNGQGIQTDAMCVTGQGGPGNVYIGNTETYDGTSWTEVADVATARGFHGQSCGTTSTASGWIAGGAAGGTPPYTNVTEEWTMAASVETVAFD